MSPSNTPESHPARMPATWAGPIESESESEDEGSYTGCVNLSTTDSPALEQTSASIDSSAWEQLMLTEATHTRAPAWYLSEPQSPPNPWIGREETPPTTPPRRAAEGPRPTYTPPRRASSDEVFEGPPPSPPLERE